MTMNVLIGLFVLQVFLTYAYDFICPSQPHWNLRANLMCMDQRNYSCLFDVHLQVNVYRDKCIRPRIVGPGYKYVFQPNPNRDSCSLSRYQPYIFNTTGYSECVLKKLPCSSEGQKTHTEGSTRSDRTCSCKQEIGYNFVSRPQNECYCNPSSEDCSCYLEIHPNKTLKECKGVSTYTAVHINLIILHGDKLNNSMALTNRDFDNLKYNIAGLKNGYSAKAVIYVLILVLSYSVIVGVCILQRSTRKMSSRIEKSEKDSTKRLKHKKPYKREQIRNQIKGWKQNSINFILTRAYEKVLESLESKSCIAVTGSGGSGKSAIVQQVSLVFGKNHGYNILIIKNAMDLEKYYCPGKKTLFVIDDLCGKFTVDKKMTDDWDSAKDLVNQVIHDPSCKMLFSCRLQVYKDPQFSRLEWFTSCECNINSEEICLTENEKELIFKSYLSSKILEKDYLLITHDNFPFLCAQYSKSDMEIAIGEFFKMPYSAYEKELNQLDTRRKEKLCGLFLCIIFNNQLKESYFQKQLPDFKQIVKDICSDIGLAESTTATCLRIELDTLEKTYVKKTEGLYQITHDKLFDFMVYYFGKKIPVCFINHADSGLIRERFLWKEDFQSEKCLIDNIVHIQNDYLSLYIERMIKDWRNGKVSDVIYNINMTSLSFRETFLNFLKDFDKNESQILANMEDCLGVGLEYGNTALMLACINSYTNLLSWLIENKANVNYQRKDGASALCIACEKGQVDVVSILLQNNADANICTNEGSSPLAYACSSHEDSKIISEIITQLLNGNASVNENKYKGHNMTPLCIACQKDLVPIAKILLQHKSDPNICLNNGMSALLVACHKNSIEMVGLLLEGKANPNIEKIDGSTPLFWASAMGLRDITELLLKENAKKDQCVYDKEDIEKKFEGTPKALKRLKKASVNIVKSFGSDETMNYIQRIGKTKLLDFVFDVVAGSSPLHMACFMGKIEIVQLLATDALSVNRSKKNSITPLVYALAIGHKEIIDILLEKRAD